ncbi:MAG: hypothetical protein AAF978_06310 [Cyanobacteria bacterium P01_E01_bin.48]
MSEFVCLDRIDIRAVYDACLRSAGTIVKSIKMLLASIGSALLISTAKSDRFWVVLVLHPKTILDKDYLGAPWQTDE